MDNGKSHSQAEWRESQGRDVKLLVNAYFDFRTKMFVLSRI